MTTSPNSLNGVRVTRRDGVIFIPLPQWAWRWSGAPCKCGHCDGKGMFDTVAVSAKPDDARDATWLVHYPELHK